MKVIYHGPSPVRTVPGVGRVERGVPVEVPAVVGVALTDQRDWARAPRRRRGNRHQPNKED